MKKRVRTLGTVFWLEAPAIYILFLLVGYGALLVADSYGITPELRLRIHFGFMGLGTVAASVYIWMASENTSRRIFTVAARLFAVAYVVLFLLVLWQSWSNANA